MNKHAHAHTHTLMQACVQWNLLNDGHTVGRILALCCEIVPFSEVEVSYIHSRLRSYTRGVIAESADTMNDKDQRNTGSNTLSRCC